MNSLTKMANLIGRVANATGARNVRRDDADRLERHDGTMADFQASAEARMPALRRLLSRIEGGDA